MRSPAARSTAFAAVLALGALTAPPPAAARCSHDIAERGLAAHKAIVAAREAAAEEQGLNYFQRRQAGTNEASEAALTDPTAECTVYSNPVVAAMEASYPAIWEIASIVTGDTEATAAYNAIISNANFPNLTVKGTPTGNFTGVVYNSTDPDCWWSWSKCTTPKHPDIPVDVHTCAEPSTWGLAYDDGPNCTHNEFYNYLQQNDYTATMFYIGSNVMDWSYQAQRGTADGHEIGVHTWSHRYSTALTNEQFFAELWYTRKAIKAILGITPTIWRPPYGDVDDRIRFIATSLNLTTVIWDDDTFDWKIQNPAAPSGLPTASVLANYDAVLQNASSGVYSTHGVIVLTHELEDATMDLAMMELPYISGNFSHVVPIGTCQNWTQPYVESEYSLPSFAEWLAGAHHGVTNSSSGTTSSASGTITSAASTATKTSSNTAVAAAAAAPTSASATSSAAAKVVLPVASFVLALPIALLLL